MAIALGDNIGVTGPLPTDNRYYNTSNNLPWTGVTQVNTALSGVTYIGLTVNISGVEYWYKDGIADIDLVEKTSGGGLLNWSGSTVNAVGTYMSVSGICAQPNLTFANNTLSVAGSVSATTLIENGTCLASTYLPYTMTTDTCDPTGFINNENIVVKYNTDRTITLSATTGTIEYYFNGVKHDLGTSWTSAAHTNDTNGWFLYSTDGTNIDWSTTVWDFKYLMVAARPANSVFALREVHGTMPVQAHQEFHQTVGTYRVNGFGLTNGTYALQPVSPTDADNTPGFEAGVIKDEDIQTSLAAWSEGTYTQIYYTGASSHIITTGGTALFRITGTYPNYNPDTGTTFTELEMAHGDFANYYAIRIPVTSDAVSQQYRAVVLQPQYVYSSLNSAEAENPQNINLGEFTNVFAEFVYVERITLRTDSGYTSTGKVRIEAQSILTGSHFNQTSTTPGTGAVTAGNVSVAPQSPYTQTNLQSLTDVYATDIQTALSSGGLAMSGSTVGGLTTYVDANTICAHSGATYDGQKLRVFDNINGDVEIRSCNQNTDGNLARGNIIAQTVSGGDLGMFTYSTGNTATVWGEAMAGASLLWAGTTTEQLLIGTHKVGSPVKIFHGGTKVMETLSGGTGISVGAGDSTVSGDTLLKLCGDRPWSFKQLGDTSSSRMSLYPEENGKAFNIVENDTLACVAQFFAGSGNSYVNLYNNGDLRLATTTAGVEVNSRLYVTGVTYCVGIEPETITMSRPTSNYIMANVAGGTISLITNGLAKSTASALVYLGTDGVILRHGAVTPEDVMCTTTTSMCFPKGLVACTETTAAAAAFYGCNTIGTGCQTAVFVSNVGTSGGQYYGISVNAVSISAGGRQYGIMACAGGGSSGYNAGVTGVLCSACDGAGIVGSVGAFPTAYAGQWAGYFCGPVCATTCVSSPISCATTCVSSPISCGTTRAQSPIVCGTTCMRTAIACATTCVQSVCLYGTTAVGGAPVTGHNTFQTTSGLAGVLGTTTSAGCGYLGLYDGTIRAGVVGYCASVTTYSTTTHAGYFYGCVCIDNTLASGYALKIDTCGCAVDFVATSDCRTKKCIEPITGALSTVDALCGRCFELCRDDTKDMGLIAQDVVKVEPRLVSYGDPSPEEKEKYGIEDQVMGLKYDKFAGLFVEAIKELKTQNECLQEQINELRNK